MAAISSSGRRPTCASTPGSAVARERLPYLLAKFTGLSSDQRIIFLQAGEHFDLAVKLDFGPRNGVPPGSETSCAFFREA